jgi:transcriptional regulator with XRE-family HTH domain
MEPSEQLATTVRVLREERGVAQATMARKAGLPKATWSALESGSANPTLRVLIAAARALEVPIEELLTPPRAELEVTRCGEVARRRRGSVEVRELGEHLERLQLAPGSAMAGVPHTRGTREVLTCEQGRLELVTMGQRVVLEPGDVVRFRGDRKHGYRNVGDGVAVGYSVVR